MGPGWDYSPTERAGTSPPVDQGLGGTVGWRSTRTLAGQKQPCSGGRGSSRVLQSGTER